MKEYQTEQRKVLMTFFENNHEKKFSAEEIFQQLPDGFKISLSAVYRNIDKMTKEGLLEKTFSANSNKAVYQYVAEEKCCERLHLRCEKCGTLMHLQNKNVETDLSALLEKNGFSLDEHATVLVGVCKNCK